MKQAEFFAQKVYNRQGYQWKVTLGLWAFIAAFVQFSYGKGILIPFWIGAGVWLGYGFIWLRGVAVRNRDDQTKEEYFRQSAEKILTSADSYTISSSPSAITPRQWRWWLGYIGNWAHLFEFGTTGVLILAGFLILRNH
jgi:hypothetical protein